MLRPHLRVDSLHQVSVGLLQELGVRGVLVDVDDTLLPAGRDAMDPASAAWLASLRPAGFRVAILSNGERERVSALATRFGCASVALSGKPFAPAFRRALRLLETQPSETAMIGDQLFTDVLGANLAGLTSILVRPLSPGKLPHTRMLRRLERMILRGGVRGGPVHR